MKNISAFTETHVATPGYISITVNNDGLNTVTVRSRGRNGITGSSSIVEMTDDELLQLADDVIAKLRPTPIVEDVKPSKK